MTRHEQLFEQYVEALQEAKKFAERWWMELVENELSIAGVLEEADKRLMRRWPNGPASHPRVLAVVRKYWLACNELNELIAQETYPGKAEPESVYVLAPESAPEEDEEQSAEETEDQEEAEVDPHIFVLEWLMDDDHDDLAEFLSSLTYWPVGLARDDQYT
jgi:hypothetical protein